MDQVPEVQATIKGDVSGQVAVGNYIMQVGDVSGGIVNFAPPSDRPAYSMRPFPVNLRPYAFPSLLDRDEESASVKAALQNSMPISIYGEKGIGKTSLARRLFHLPDLPNFPTGVVYLDTSGRGLDDLLQSLFDAFYESLPEFKPRDIEIRHGLQGLEALIFLDDVNLSRDETISLLNAAPKSTFVFSSVERSLWGEGQIILLRGLPEKDALALFAREIGRPMNEEEQAAAMEICALLKGNPWHIVQATSLVRETSKQIGSLLEELKRDVPEKAVLQAALSNLNEYQGRNLAMLAVAGESAIPIEHLIALSQDPNARKTLRELISLGLAQAHSPRYSLTGNVASSLATLWDLSSWEDMLADYFLNWLEGQPAQELIEESAEALLHIIKRAGEREDWPKVIRLGRALERSLILWKRWQAWAEILNLILRAARALGDRKVEAWALHQLGSRALCLGQADRARELLTEALNIRKAIRDRAGQAITQHNLNVLLRGSVPPNGGKSGGRPWLLGKIALIIVVLMSTITTIYAAAPEPVKIKYVPAPILTAVPIQLPPLPLPTPIRLDRITPAATFTPSQFPPSLVPTFTPTNLIPDAGLTNTPTSTDTPTPTETSRAPQWITSTPSHTPTPTVTSTITPEPSITPTPSIAVTPDVYGPPAPIIVSPQTGSTIDCVYKTVSLAWQAVSDPSGISSYQVDIYTSYESAQGPWQFVDKQNPSQTSLEIWVDCDVWYSWEVKAYDGAGNPGTASAGFFTTFSIPTPTPDTVGPTISDLFAYPTTVNTGNCDVTFAASISDPSGIDSAWVAWTNSDGASDQVPMLESEPDFWVVTFAVKVPSSGALSWSVLAYDKLLNKATLDSSEPVISLPNGCF